ncbi:MAG: hypothetical protein RLZZ347_149 [Candidatus Parcubacteria bacterium]
MENPIEPKNLLSGQKTEQVYTLDARGLRLLDRMFVEVKDLIPKLPADGKVEYISSSAGLLRLYKLETEAIRITGVGNDYTRALAEGLAKRIKDELGIDVGVDA